MATLSVSLPDRMKEYIDAQVEGGDFADTADYLRDLVRRDQERRIEELRQIVDDALASGISTRTMQDIKDEGDRIAKERGYL